MKILKTRKRDKRSCIKPIVIILSGIFLLYSPISAAETSYFDKEIGISFDETIAGFTYGNRRTYDEPGLGYSMAYYKESGIVITVYVYDLGVVNLGNGIEDNETAQRAFQDAIADIYKIAQMGYYKNVFIKEALSQKFDERIKAEWLIYSVAYDADREYFKDKAGPKLSHLLLTVRKGKFIKIRSTYENMNDVDYVEDISGFVLAILGKFDNS